MRPKVAAIILFCAFILLALPHHAILFSRDAVMYADLAPGFPVLCCTAAALGSYISHIDASQGYRFLQTHFKALLIAMFAFTCMAALHALATLCSVLLGRDVDAFSTVYIQSALSFISFLLLSLACSQFRTGCIRSHSDTCREAGEQRNGRQVLSICLSFATGLAGIVGWCALCIGTSMSPRYQYVTALIAQCALALVIIVFEIIRGRYVPSSSIRWQRASQFSGIIAGWIYLVAYMPLITMPVLTGLALSILSIAFTLIDLIVIRTTIRAVFADGHICGGDSSHNEDLRALSQEDEFPNRELGNQLLDSRLDSARTWLQGTFPDSPLSKGEITCLAYALCGLSSSESAAIQNIKAATVRSYLSHAYKKLRVESLSVLKEAYLAAIDGIDNEKTSAVQQESDQTRRTSSLVPAFVRTASLGLLSVLVFIIPAPWMVMRGWCVSNAMAAGALLAVAALGAGRFSLSQWRNGQVCHRLHMVCLAVLFISIAVIVSYTVMFSLQPQFAWSFPLISSVAVGLCTAALLGLVVQSPTSTIEAPRYNWSPAKFFVFALAALVLGSLSSITWALVVSLLCIMEIWDGVVRIMHSHVDVRTIQNARRQQHSSRAVTPRRDAALQVAGGLLVGFLIQESWHFFSSYSSRLFEFPAIVIFGVGLFRRADRVIHVSELPASLRILAIALACALCVVQSELLTGCLALVVLLADIVLSTSNRVEEHCSSRILGIWALVFGILFGTLLENAMGVVAVYSAEHGQTFPLVLDTGARAFLIGLSTLVLSCIVTLDLEARRHEVSEYAPQNADRVRSYLIGRGLNITQAEVTVLIARGYSGPTIARKLTYSLGTVNAARREAYLKLGVHSKGELKILLAEHVDFRC